VERESRQRKRGFRIVKWGIMVGWKQISDQGAENFRADPAEIFLIRISWKFSNKGSIDPDQFFDCDCDRDEKFFIKDRLKFFRHGLLKIFQARSGRDKLNGSAMVRTVRAPRYSFHFPAGSVWNFLSRVC